MQKDNYKLIVKGLKSLAIFSLLNFTFTSNVRAIQKSVSIQDLPGYVTSNNFYLSCSALGGNSAVFEYRKEAGVYQTLATIDVSVNECQTIVDSSKINEETKYYFRVTLDGTVSDETSTTYDVSGPSNISDYKKDGASDNNIVLHWRNPNNSDFSKVIIYRGETSDFTADGNHEIATVFGSPDSQMTHTVNVPDNSKTYYYLIRALDKAGNSSGLVGDVSLTATVTTVNPAGTSQNGSSNVTVLPKTSGSGGQVLGTDAEKVESTATPSSITVEENSTGNQNSNNKYYYGIGLLVLGFVLYFFFKKGKK